MHLARQDRHTEGGWVQACVIQGGAEKSGVKSSIQMMQLVGSLSAEVSIGIAAVAGKKLGIATE